MKTPNLTGTLVYTSKLNNKEIYFLLDDVTVSRIKDITKAYIVGGHVFISLAERINILFNQKFVNSIIQNTDTEIVVELSDLSVDTETIDLIGHSMPVGYKLSSIHCNEGCDYDGNTCTTLNIVYRT